MTSCVVRPHFFSLYTLSTIRQIRCCIIIGCRLIISEVISEQRFCFRSIIVRSLLSRRSWRSDAHPQPSVHWHLFLVFCYLFRSIFICSLFLSHRSSTPTTPYFIRAVAVRPHEKIVWTSQTSRSKNPPLDVNKPQINLQQLCSGLCFFHIPANACRK